MKYKVTSRKGQSALNLLILGPIFIVISGLIVTMLSSTVASIGATQTNAVASNVSNFTLTGVSQVTNQYGTIGLIIVASIIIGLVFSYILARFMPAGGGFG
jgi:hypothetical protein